MEQSKSKKPIDEISASIRELSADIKQIRQDLSYIKSKMREEVVKEKAEQSLKDDDIVEIKKSWWW